MPKDAQITIRRRDLPSDFVMPQMEAAAEHYSIGFLISGDRRIITPYRQIDAHRNDFVVMPPMMYHRTFSLSDSPYINYLIKISPKIADAFCQNIGSTVWQNVFDSICISLDEKNTRKAQDLLADMLELYEEDREYSEVLLQGLLSRLVVLLWEKNVRRDSMVFKNKLSREIMEVMYYIEQNYAADIRLSDAAASAGFSEGHLSRLFTSQVGVTFSDYLINVRLRHVKELLLNTDRSISEIAVVSGFSNADYLSSCFHRKEGITPSAFRRGNVE